MSTPWPSWPIQPPKLRRTAIKGFVIAATGSGTGKTTYTLAILAWLRNKGLRVAPFKVGPDFIDPGHHTHVAGRTSYNLDSWMLSREYNEALFRQQGLGADIAVVEGVMGLFDGYDALSETGSTAQMAKWLGLPVLLIVSAKGKARSAAAVVKGFESFDPDLNLCGVVFSQTGSQRHYDYLREAVEQTCTTPCLGHMLKNDSIVMPERHLGLTTADEHVMSDQTLSTLVSMVDEGLDMDGLIRSLPDIPGSGTGDDEPVRKTGLVKKIDLVKEISTAKKNDLERTDRPRIAVARDKAFCFYYPDNFQILEQVGADLVYFSPLTDGRLPSDIDGIYLGGGYPELSARDLSEQTDLLAEILACSRNGMPIYGECGGFMFLCRALAPGEGESGMAMTGCFNFSVSMSKRLRSLGYREITFIDDTVIGRKGDMVRGHEFHYSSLASDADSEARDVYRVTSRAGQDVIVRGFQKYQTLGSYLHVHFASNPDTARCFVDHCREFRQKRQAGLS